MLGFGWVCNSLLQLVWFCLLGGALAGLKGLSHRLLIVILQKLLIHKRLFVYTDFGPHPESPFILEKNRSGDWYSRRRLYVSELRRHRRRFISSSLTALASSSSAMLWLHGRCCFLQQLG